MQFAKEVVIIVTIIIIIIKENYTICSLHLMMGFTFFFFSDYIYIFLG